MYAFAVLGEQAEDALGRLLPELDGRVGTVRVDGVAADSAEASGDKEATDGGKANDNEKATGGEQVSAGGARTDSERVTNREAPVVRGDTEYVLDDGWQATGAGLSLDDALDRLAPDHDYAAVLGTRDTGLPAITVGRRDEDALVAVERPGALDVEATIDAIHGTEPHETLESLVAAVERSPEAEYAGAIATFTGRVRAKEDAEDDRTRYLEFEKYEGLADRRLRAIESALADREGVLAVRLHHRTGRVDGGGDIVFVVVLAGHREEAFRAVQDGIDRLKDEVPLFKKEVTDDGTFWVHERAE